jgi:hypothetical protein
VYLVGFLILILILVDTIFIFCQLISGQDSYEVEVSPPFEGGVAGIELMYLTMCYFSAGVVDSESIFN